MSYATLSASRDTAARIRVQAARRERGKEIIYRPYESIGARYEGSFATLARRAATGCRREGE